jgi:DNA-3-methyladenine glycosylase II
MNRSTESLTIEPKPPFSLDLSAQIFKEGDPQIRKYENGKFTQLIRVDKKLVLITLESKGTVGSPILSAKLTSNEKLSVEQKKIAVSKIRSLFNMDLDLKSFYETAKKDEVLEKVTEKLQGLRSPATQTVFESLTDSIIEQQISLKVAHTIERKIVKEYGESFSVNEQKYFVYPTPKALEAVAIEEFRKCGLSSNKAEYIKGIATQIQDGKLDLEKFKQYENSKTIVQELEAIRGIGVWTAKLTVIRSMHKWDVFPADDIGLRRILAHYYNEDQKISSDQANEIAKPWGKWKGLAAYYFVVAEDMQIGV